MRPLRCSAASCSRSSLPARARAWSWPDRRRRPADVLLRPAHPYAGGQHAASTSAAQPASDVARPGGRGRRVRGHRRPANGLTSASGPADGYTVSLTHLGSLARRAGASVGRRAPRRDDRPERDAASTTCRTSISASASPTIDERLRRSRSRCCRRAQPAAAAAAACLPRLLPASPASTQPPVPAQQPPLLRRRLPRRRRLRPRAGAESRTTAAPPATDRRAETARPRRAPTAPAPAAALPQGADAARPVAAAAPSSGLPPSGWPAATCLRSARPRCQPGSTGTRTPTSMPHTDGAAPRARSVDRPAGGRRSAVSTATLRARCRRARAGACRPRGAHEVAGRSRRRRADTRLVPCSPSRPRSLSAWATRSEGPLAPGTYH